MTRVPAPVKRLALVTIVGVAFTVATPTGAFAHSELERSEPPNGGMVAEGRTTLSLWFSQPILIEGSTFTLYSLGDQSAVTVRSSSADGQGFASGGDEVATSIDEVDEQGFVELGTTPLPKAIYQLDYTALSAVDGHPARGSVVFGAGIRPVVVGGGGADALPDAPNLLLRWLELSAVMLAIGAIAVATRIVAADGVLGGSVRRRVLTIGAAAATAAIVLGVLTPFFKEPHSGWALGAWYAATRDALTTTSWGRLWMLREMALVIVAVALWSRARPGSEGRLAVPIAAMSGAVWFGAWAGHASGLPRLSGAAAVASALHLASAGVWAGGLVVLAICLIPTMRRDPDARGPLIASAWRAFSPVAAISAVVLVASGLYEMGRYLPDLGFLSSTLYGRVVAGKIGLIAVALAIAAFNTLLVNPRLAAPVGRVLGRADGWSPVSLHRFSTLIVAEAAVLVLAVGGAALLTSVATGREIEVASRQTAPVNTNVDGLFLTFEEVPLGADASRLIVRTRSIVKPDPAPVIGVDVQLEGPSGADTQTTLDEVEPGRYEVEADRLAPGTWQISVDVNRDGLPAARASFDWQVLPDIPEGARPFELVMSGVAVLLLVLLGAVLTVVRRLRVTPPTRSPELEDEKAGARP